MEKKIILYVDDDLDDLLLFKMSFEDYKHIGITHFFSGKGVIDYLLEAHGNNNLPCLIVLDVNLPGVNGRELLQSIRENELLKHLPVVLFSTSSSHPDREFAMKWHAPYRTKPALLCEQEKLAAELAEYCACLSGEMVTDPTRMLSV